MMSDSGLQIETENETVQPDEVVATESEATEAAPLAEDTETEEFEVTIDADQQNEGEDGKEIDYRAMALAKAEKAKKEREKRKAAEDREKELQERLNRLESQVSEVSAGPKPNADDYYGDPEGYAKALNEWESKKKPQQRETKQSDDAAPEVPEGILSYQYESEEKMRSQYKAYDDKHAALSEKMSKMGVNPETTLASLADICVGMDGVDYATAVIAMNEVPGALETVFKAANSGSRGLVQKHIRDAASKVKLSRRQKIDTKPEPSVASTGGIDSAQAELAKAREAYTESPTQANFARVQAAKKKLKS